MNQLSLPSIALETSVAHFTIVINARASSKFRRLPSQDEEVELYRFMAVNTIVEKIVD